jgi:hypothetical protein
MEPLTLLWVCSLLGAALFTAGGFLAARGLGSGGLEWLRLELDLSQRAAAAAISAKVELDTLIGEKDAEILSARRRCAEYEAEVDRARHDQAALQCELEAQRAAAAQYRGRVENLAREVATLKATQRVARTVGNTNGAGTHGAVAAVPVGPLAHARGRMRLAAILDRAVQDIARADTSANVAVADLSGLLVASRGEHAEALAAFGAVAAETRAKAEQLLPIEGACEVSVRTREGRVLSTQAISSHLTVVALACDLKADQRVREVALRLPALEDS